MNKINLVTGANGHLGNNLTRALLARGETVRASVRNPKNTKPFEGLNCEIVQADLLDKPSLLRAMEGVDTLYQVAAVFRHWSPNPEKDIIQPNMPGTRNVIEAAAETRVRRIVYISSTVTLPHIQGKKMNENEWNTDFHNNPYYQSKTESEKLAWELAKKHGLSMVAVLPSAIIGPNDFSGTLTMNTLRLALNNGFFADINFYLNYVHVEDLVAGIIAAAEKVGNGERYILSTETPINSRRLVELAKELNPEVKIPARAPRWLLMTIAAGMELFGRITGREPLLLRNQVALYYGNPLTLNIQKAQKQLGFNPRPAELALRQTLTWLAQN